MIQSWKKLNNALWINLIDSVGLGSFLNCILSSSFLIELQKHSEILSTVKIGMQQIGTAATGTEVWG